jgi:hypothetical protein
MIVNISLAKRLLPEIEEMIDTLIMDNMDSDGDMDDLVDQHDSTRKYIIEQLAKGIK